MSIFVETTIITCTSWFRSMPEMTMLLRNLISLRAWPEMKDTRNVICCDQIPSNTKWDTAESWKLYQQYKRHLRILADEEISPFNNSIILEAEEHKHLTGNLKQAFDHGVETPYVFVNQHDILYEPKVRLDLVNAAMDENEVIQYVAFARCNPFRNRFWLADCDFAMLGKDWVGRFGYDRLRIARGHGWTDGAFLCRTEHLTDVVFPILKKATKGDYKTAMEHVMQPVIRACNRDNELLRDYGVFVYQEQAASHLEGRSMDGGIRHGSHGVNKMKKQIGLL